MSNSITTGAFIPEDDYKGIVYEKPSQAVKTFLDTVQQRHASTTMEIAKIFEHFHTDGCSEESPCGLRLTAEALTDQFEELANLRRELRSLPKIPFFYAISDDQILMQRACANISKNYQKQIEYTQMLETCHPKYLDELQAKIGEKIAEQELEDEYAHQVPESEIALETGAVVNEIADHILDDLLGELVHTLNAMQSRTRIVKAPPMNDLD